MSSVAGGPILSDDLANGQSRRNGTSNAINGRGAPRSSMPPSESGGALSDVEGFPDDEVVGVRGTDRNRPRDPMARAVPKVVDRVGEKVAEEFENFMEQCARSIQDRHSGKLTGCFADSLKISHFQERLHRVR